MLAMRAGSGYQAWMGRALIRAGATLLLVALAGCETNQPAAPAVPATPEAAHLRRPVDPITRVEMDAKQALENFRTEVERQAWN